MRFLRHAFATYLRLLETHPYKTKALTSATIMTSGDLLGQKVIQKKEEINWGRTRSFTVFGLALGCVLHPWYLALARWTSGITSKPVQIGAMLLLDQGIMAPGVSSVFWGTVPLIEGQSIDAMKEAYLENLKLSLTANYKLWPLANLINFTFVPMQGRVLFVNAVSIGWNSYISWLGHRHESSEHQTSDVLSLEGGEGEGAGT